MDNIMGSFNFLAALTIYGFKKYIFVIIIIND